MGFQNRAHAAELLANRLETYRGMKPLVLAIPRAGVAVGRVVANRLGGDLDVTLVEKLRSPDNRAFEIGQVHESGHVHLGTAAATLEVGESAIRREVTVLLESLRLRRQEYTPGRRALDPANRVVILVDDVAMSGSTLATALRGILAGRPAKLIAAFAVGRPHALELASCLADETICLRQTGDAEDPASYFIEFPPVSEREVISVLASGSREMVEAWSPT